jgi:hypothetical protein
MTKSTPERAPVTSVSTEVSVVGAEATHHSSVTIYLSDDRQVRLVAVSGSDLAQNATLRDAVVEALERTIQAAASLPPSA